MKWIAGLVVAGVALTSWRIGYWTGTLDEGARLRYKIEMLERRVSGEEASFKDAYDKFVSCVRNQEQKR